MSERVDYVVVGLGGLGAAACAELAGRGHRVVGLDRFELGHARGASHDTSRILRHSYHTPGYVRLTQQAYRDWARLERDTGEALVTRVGGLDLFPPAAAIDHRDYTASLDAVGIGHELLDVDEVGRRWPQLRLPPGTLTLHQPDAAIVPAGRTVRALHELARQRGAELRPLTPVLGLDDDGAGVVVRTAQGSIRCDGVVVCADAWVNDVLGSLGVRLPVDVTLEQVTYFRPPDPLAFAPHRMPLWIWMDDPSYYGFPCYGEATVKAAQDCGGPRVDPDERSSSTDAALLAGLVAHVDRVLPGAGEPVRSVRCQYTLTPDRDFVLSAVPEHPRVVVGLGAAHGFKFVPTFGRLLADLVAEGGTDLVPAGDLAAFRFDRPALTDPTYQAHWLV